MSLMSETTLTLVARVLAGLLAFAVQAGGAPPWYTTKRPKNGDRPSRS
jgi:hypothetical protein